jgi:hypothetical protein
MAEQIKSYRDLRVYQAAFELQQEIFEVSKAFPIFFRNRDFSISRLRRSTGWTQPWTVNISAERFMEAC